MVLAHVQLQSRKKRMASLAKPGVGTEKLGRMNAQMIFQQNYIIRKQEQVDIATTAPKATHSGVAMKLKCFRFAREQRAVRWCQMITIHYDSCKNKKAGMKDSCQLKSVKDDATFTASARRSRHSMLRYSQPIRE